MKAKWQRLSLSLLAALGIFMQQQAVALQYESYLESWDSSWKNAMKYLPPGPGGTADNSYKDVTLNISFGCYSFPGLNGLQFAEADVNTVVNYVQGHGGKARISFGGPSNSTPCYPNYFISQTSGWPSNSAALAAGVLSAVSTYNFDGVDFNFEDPVRPNITQQQFAKELIVFLKNVRKGLPEGKTLSITIPGQGWDTYWYYLARGVAAVPGLVDYINFMEYDIWVNPNVTYYEQILADLLTYTSPTTESPGPNSSPGWGIPAELIQLGLMPGCDDGKNYLSTTDAKKLASEARLQKLYGVMTWDLDRDAGTSRTPACNKYPYSYLYSEGIRNAFAAE